MAETGTRTLSFRQAHVISFGSTPPIQVKGEDGKLHTKWLWPNGGQDGSGVDFSGQALKATATLRPGPLLDRFGHEDTAYFAPFATPHAMRALPPSSLNDPYTAYVVKKALTVHEDPIALGFQEPGLRS